MARIIKINSNKFNIVFLIPWYFPCSNAWKQPINNSLNDKTILWIKKSNVMHIVSSSDFIKIKITSVKTIDPILKIPFNGMALPTYFGAEE